MNQSFKHAGYLVIHVDPSLFALSTGSKEKDEYFWLTDKKGNVIHTNADQSVTLPEPGSNMSYSIDGREFFTVSSHITPTDWNVQLLTSTTTLIKGLIKPTFTFCPV